MSRGGTRPGTGAGDVLVLRALGLGDALTGVAALRGVRRAWPDRRLVLAAPSGVGRWLQDLGVVDAVLPATGLEPLDRSLLDGGGHVAVNLHGRGPQSHDVLGGTGPERLVAFRCEEAGHDAGPTWRADEHEVDRWCRLVTDAGGACSPEDLRLPRPPGTPTDQVVLHPGAASASRRWPVDRWGALAAELVSRGLPIMLTGGRQERELCAAVARAATDRAGPAGKSGVRSTAGELDLPALAGVVAGARLVVCGDTGVAHVATAFATPSVLLFGPTPPRWWGPAIDVDQHAVLWHGTPDRPGDPHGSEVDPALARITVEEVLAAAERLL